MTLDIMKLVFTIVISAYWSTANDIPAAVEFPISYVDESLLQLCEDELISLNFSNAVIKNINEDFISSTLITCLNLTGNRIEKIERGAFNKLPNLTQLLLSDNRLPCEFLSFGGHCKLQVLVMNNARCRNTYDYYNYYRNVQIFEYPNLEVLSLRNNFITDLYLSTEKVPPVCTTSIIMPNTRFPKLRIVDLSENNIRDTNFLTLLPNSLYFLDLHNNSLETLYLQQKAKLSILNVDKNNLRNIDNYNRYSSYLSLAGLKNLRYLSVSANNIYSVGHNAFQDTNELLYLNLSVNYIRDIDSGTFKNLHYLKTLDLSKNQFQNVPLIYNEGISTLYISYNNIKQLKSHSFVHMPKLTKLLLRGNKINATDVNAFAKLSVLEKLDLSRNMLSSLPEGWSESLVSLKYLNLSDNQFTSLESLSLTTAPLSLTEIYLMMNPLKLYLNVGYFESLPQNLTINLMDKSNFTKWKRVGE